MQDERGYPSGGMDPDESLSDETSSDAWYFETPEERWARQEAKNRALQDAIRQKLRSQPEKKEPFRHEPSPEARASKGRRGLFGRGRHDDETAAVASEPGPAKDDWSTEPWNAAPAPPPERPRDRVEPPAEAAPMSRWDEMFSAKAGDDSIVDAMRRWSESSNPTADRGQLPDDVEARLRALEADELGVEDAPEGSASAFDPDVETRLHALESGKAAVTMESDAAAGPMDPEMEDRLRALEAGGDGETAYDSAAADEAPIALDPEMEARLRALEADEEDDAYDAAPGVDQPVALDPDLEARLRALEADGDETAAYDAAPGADQPAAFDATSDPSDGVDAVDDASVSSSEAAAAPGRDEDEDRAGDTRPDIDLYTDDMPGQSARRWREIFGIEQEEPPAAPPMARMAPGYAPEEGTEALEGFEPAWDAAPVEPGASGPPELGAWDANATTTAGGNDWMPAFLADPAQPQPTPVSDDDDGWAPEFARPEPATGPVAATADPAWMPGQADDETITASGEEPSTAERVGVEGPAGSETGSSADEDADASDDDVPAAPGVLGAAAASVVAGEPEPDPWGASWARDDADDPWSTARSLTGVPADASPNWPFPEPAGGNDAEIPDAAADGLDDDPWGVNPVDELEARLRALEEEAAAPAAADAGAAARPSAWPAQELGTSTAWPAQVNYERPADEEAALYREAGVLETLDEIMDDGADPEGTEPPIVMGHSFDPSRFAGIREADEAAPPTDAEPAQAPHGYLRRPDEFDEPTPSDGTARLIEPIVLVPDEAIEAGEGDDGGDGFGVAPAPSPSEEPSWLRDEDALEDIEARHGSRARTLIREIVETGMLAVLVFLAVRASFQNFRVEGESMFPTLEDGEFLIVNRLVYSEVDMEGLSTLLPWIDAEEGETKHLFHGPDRGDIIVFRDPRDISDDLIKRVIGLPGDTIEIRDGVVYINDLELDEPYLTESCTSSCDKSKILIPENEYFVMGDNRNNSHDSRFQDIGLVHEDLIIGKALVSYWPRSAFGLAENEKPHCIGSPDCQPLDGAETEERAGAAGD